MGGAAKKAWVGGVIGVGGLPGSLTGEPASALEAAMYAGREEGAECADEAREGREGEGDAERERQPMEGDGERSLSSWTSTSRASVDRGITTGPSSSGRPWKYQTPVKR
jgi:hypothetical protein